MTLVKLPWACAPDWSHAFDQGDERFPDFGQTLLLVRYPVRHFVGEPGAFYRQLGQEPDHVVTQALRTLIQGFGQKPG